VAEVLDELGIGGKVIALDAISCGTSSALGIDFGRVITAYDRPSDVATVTKRAEPDAFVLLIQDDLNIAIMADSFVGALIRGEKFTMIMCTDIDCGRNRRQPAPVTSFTAGENREVAAQGYPMNTAELVATFKGVAYSARGAVTSPVTYQRAKDYISTAFQKQINNVGFSFVEILCACAASDWWLTAADCLKEVRERTIDELPLGEFKNVDHIE
ncbi:hypothetical protein ACFLTZ_07185, partial [Chloroflexota bacterium]